MLTIDDGPTIRNAITKRIDKEPGCSICDIKIIEKPDCILVAVMVIIDDSISETGLIDVRSSFELPTEFELIQVHNQIDEIAEACKAARRKAGVYFRFNPYAISTREKLPGTGRRNWS